MRPTIVPALTTPKKAVDRSPIYATRTHRGTGPACCADRRGAGDQAANPAPPATTGCGRDQVVDFCEDWAVPYLATWSATAWCRRWTSAVAAPTSTNTIFYYRRRAGHEAVARGLIADVTRRDGTRRREFAGWFASPTGSIRRRAPQRPVHRHARARAADLRRPLGQSWVDGMGRVSPHRPDVRRNTEGSTGDTGSHRVACHCSACSRTASSARCRACSRRRKAPVRFAFDPSGRANPLFQRHSGRALRSTGAPRSSGS